jgi:NADH-quinone oxidoreductase subunit C
MALSSEIVLEKIKAKFGEAVSENTESLDLLTVNIDRSQAHELVKFLKEEETLRFNFLTTLCGFHYPNNDVESQFAVAYHMHNWVDNFRIRIKTYLNGVNPEVDSMTDLFLSSNWQERETYDFYGIEFKNHPDLKRILNMDEMVSFPMRKEFPLEDANRTDKDDRYFGRLPQNTNLN